MTDVADTYLRNMADAQSVSLHYAKALIKKLGIRDDRLIAKIESIMDSMTDAQRLSMARGKSSKASAKIYKLIREHSAYHAAQLEKTLEKMSKGLITESIKDVNRYTDKSTPAKADLSFAVIGMTISEVSKRSAGRLDESVRSVVRESATAENPTSSFRQSMRIITGGSVVSGLLSKRNNGVLQWSDTTATSAVNQAHDQIAKAQKVEREVIVETLDGRTCLVCAENDGKVFPRGVGIFPPVHIGCRGVRMPYDATSKVRRPYVRNTGKYQDQPISKTPKDQRIQGKAKPRTTFREWFERNPESWKRRYLGKSRYKLYKEGGLSLKQFSRYNRPLNLKELRALNKSTFEQVGL